MANAGTTGKCKLKPVIAKIEDSKERKMVLDSMSQLMRNMYYGSGGNSNKNGGYGAIAKAQRTRHMDSTNARPSKGDEREARIQEVQEHLANNRLGREGKNNG